MIDDWSFKIPQASGEPVGGFLLGNWIHKRNLQGTKRKASKAE
jgi:hypothetical protein